MAACRRSPASSTRCPTAPDHTLSSRRRSCTSPLPPTPPQTAIAFARLSGAVDALSSVIAGFALLAGARAFMFIALLGWREPVLGGAGLVLLAMVGWLRWQCGGIAAAHAASRAARRASRRRTLRRRGDHAGRIQLPCADARNVACYNRPTQCDATARSGAAVEPASCGLRART